MNIPEEYTLLRQEKIRELDSEAYLLRHRRSGARLFLLENDDRNKVFTIGFRTPVSDNTGVPHILEHSVLCGSEKFPVKDPFIEMEKSSLRTYLNAMTFADKTIYPVASCNDQDFQNLMDVYLDAVFHPQIYQNEKIFQQEGWHYELASPEGELTVNGVVYNEMKGAFSSPEEVLERYCQAALFPDTTYGFESGGDPEMIPTLSYEEFLHFHSTYYHPCNSYIFLYGDMDMEEKLCWLDREYLCGYEPIPVDSEIRRQEPFPEPRTEEIFYPLEPDESPEGQTYLSMNWVLGEILDPVLYLAFQVLETALLCTEGAPLKQALLDAGIGRDVFGGYRNWTLQPYFSLIVKNAEKEQLDAFCEVVESTLRDLVENGIGEKALLAALNNLEFRSREADSGSYPKGIMYGITCFDSWLYDENDPFMHLRYEETLAFLRKNLSTGYFEELVKTYFLENTHRASVVLSPQAGLGEARERKLSDQLAVYKASLSPEEVQALVRQTRDLNRYQNQKPTREQLDTLPTLSLSDLSREITPLSSEERQIGGIPVVLHETHTGGILYLRFLYDISRIPAEKLSTLSIFRSLLTLVDTEKRPYRDLAQEIDIHTGGIGTVVSCFEPVDQPGAFTPYFEVRLKVIKEELPQALALVKEIENESLFTDGKRLRELISLIKSRAQMRLLEGGHSTAVARAASYGSAASYYTELLGGLDYYRCLEDLEAHFPERQEKLAAGLAQMSAEVFSPERLLVSVTCSAEEYPALEAALPACVGRAERRTAPVPMPEFLLEKKNEGLKTTAQVQYVACCGNYRKAGLSYTGALRVLRSILSNEFLWNELRVKGGAYGCMCNFARNGDSYLVSYRDPHLRRTFETYQAIVPYLESFEIEEKDMERFIISTIGSMDRPLGPLDWGICSFSTWMSGLTPEMRQRTRDEVLDCSQEDIRALAPYVAAVLAQEQRCVVGNSGKIERDRDLFGTTENLFRAQAAGPDENEAEEE